MALALSCLNWEQSASFKLHQTLLWEYFWEPSRPDFLVILVHLIKTKHPTSRQIQSLLSLPDYNGVIYKNPSAIRWGKNTRALRQAADLTPPFHSNQRQSFHRRAKQDIKKRDDARAVVRVFFLLFVGLKLLCRRLAGVYLMTVDRKQCVDVKEVIWT